jgi:hypothetical protein
MGKMVQKYRTINVRRREERYNAGVHMAYIAARETPSGVRPEVAARARHKLGGGHSAAT